MPVTAAQVKELRDKTGAGIMDSKRALEESAGDIAKAESILNAKGLASAAKKADRSTSEGLVVSYIHTGGRVGSMVELNCETDFAAKNNDFITFAEEISKLALASSGIMEDILISKMTNNKTVKNNLIDFISKNMTKFFGTKCFQCK